MRVTTVIRATQRAEDLKLTCKVCSAQVKKGESYTWAKGRYTPKMVHCYRHKTWKRSELTTSLMADVYDAIETAEETIQGASDVSEIESALSEVESVRDDIVSQYETAAEAFNNAGPNQDAADELSGWDLDYAGPDQSEIDELEDEEAKEEKLQEARDHAQELLDDCPR